MADIGVETTLKIISKLKTNVKEKKIKDAQGVRDELKLVMTEMLESRESTVALNTKPSVILLIGVNGVGKTTTAAKLAHLSYKPREKGYFRRSRHLPRSGGRTA